MNREILVSVIIPAYESALFLREAVESVRIQNVPLEIILIDDCGSDGTSALIDDLQQQYPEEITAIHNPHNLGAAQSRNAGIRIARGKYIAFLDADDVWREGKLQDQLQKMEETGCVLCCTARELITQTGESMHRIMPVDAKITYRMLLHSNQIPCSSVLVKTEVVRAFYMEHAELHEDYILWLKILRTYGDACGINYPYLLSRMTEGGKSRNKWKSAKMTYGVYRVIGIGVPKSLWYFLCYAFHGVKKYYARRNKNHG